MYPRGSVQTDRPAVRMPFQARSQNHARSQSYTGTLRGLSTKGQGESQTAPAAIKLYMMAVGRDSLPLSPAWLRDPLPRGLRVLVLGLGRFGGGVGVTRWLAAQGARVTVTDSATAPALTPSLREIADLDVALHLVGHDPSDLDTCDIVVVNPAVVKQRSEFFAEIERRERAWTTELNLFCGRCPGFVVGVTGSYGKSTTSAMLAATMNAGVDKRAIPFDQVLLGGNIGRSLFGELEAITPRTLVVLEMSNAQLEDLPQIDWAPQLAVLTNLWPHHLDRHGTLDEYVRAKLNILGDPSESRTLITGPLHPRARELLGAALLGNEQRIVEVETPHEPIPLRVPGAHNQQNAACVLSVARALGLPEEITRATLAEFRGLPDRLQFVGMIDGVAYYNDSKSTAPSATIQAMASFDRPVVLIVGGQEKNVPLEEWAKSALKSCRAVVATGASGPNFAGALRTALHSAAMIPVRQETTLPEAVRTARTLARADDVILFSPGAPSFDQYHNYAERGACFVQLVHEMQGVPPAHKV